MSTALSTNGLLAKVREFVLSDSSQTGLDALVKYAIIQADKEARAAGQGKPLAWDVVPYDELRTRAPADITAITQAAPGVFTADSRDTDITGHGFSSNDIVLVSGVSGMIEVNNRLFILTKINATTFSLKDIQGYGSLTTSGYTEYDASGAIYHVGYIVSTSNILAGANSKWTLKRFLPSPLFDGHPATPIDESEVRNEQKWLSGSYAQRPFRWREWMHQTAMQTFSRYLFFYPPANEDYNVNVLYQKEVPDIATWSDSEYPFHPVEVHDFLWHGALAHLSGIIQRGQRSTEQRVNTQIEILMAQHWVRLWEDDKRRIKALSQEMSGAKGGYRSLSA